MIREIEIFSIFLRFKKYLNLILLILLKFQEKKNGKSIILKIHTLKSL